MQAFSWLSKQWRDIKGNVKFALLLYFPALVAGLKAMWGRLSFWELFAVVCAISSGWVILAYALAKGPFKSNHQTEQNGAKLRIHSAFYGIGNANDIDLTERLQNLRREGLWLYVGNNLIPGIGDPAPGREKDLSVEYSFGNDSTKHKIIRREGAELVLPVDKGFIERTAAEYDKKCKEDLALKDREIAKLNEGMAQLKPPPTPEGFRTETDIIDVEDISIASVDFLRTDIPVKAVTAEIAFVNADGFEVERIPYGEWSGARGPEIDFARDEKRRLTIATKVNKSIAAQVGGFDAAKTSIDVKIPAVGIRVEIILKYLENSKPLTSTFVFQLGSTPEGRLRLFKRFHSEANTGSIPSS